MAGKRKQIQVRNDLIERAFAILKELAIPVAVLLPDTGTVLISGEMEQKFAILLEGDLKVYTNADARHACAIIEDFAEFSYTARTKVIEARIERAIEQSEWGKPGDDDEPKK